LNLVGFTLALYISQIAWFFVLDWALFYNTN